MASMVFKFGGGGAAAEIGGGGAAAESFVYVLGELAGEGAFAEVFRSKD